MFSTAQKKSPSPTPHLRPYRPPTAHHFIISIIPALISFSPYCIPSIPHPPCEQTKKTRFVILRVSGTDVNVEYISTRKDVLADLKKRLDDVKSAIILYDYEFVTADGRKSDKMYLFSYIPDGANPVDRVSTSHALKGYHAQCNGTILAEVDDKDNFTDFIVKEEPDATRL
jgi:hypothetical protein